jgi:hypothetical protein
MTKLSRMIGYLLNMKVQFEQQSIELIFLALLTQAQ